MRYPVIEIDGEKYLVLMIDGDDYLVTINQLGEVESPGMSNCELPLYDSLEKEGYEIIDDQTIKEFLDAQLQ